MTKNIVFVAPYFMDATKKFIQGATKCPGVRVGLVSCDPLEKLSSDIRSGLAAHYRVEDISTPQLLKGVQAVESHFGKIDRLLGMLEQIQVPLGEIRDRLGIEGMGARVANHFRDKGVMKDIFRAHGVPTARHGVADSIDSAFQIAQYTSFPLIVKPPAGAGSQGTFRCEDQTQLAECLQYIQPTPQRSIVLEEFIVGQEHSFDSACINGQVVWSSVSDYFPSCLEVVREPWIQWCVLIPNAQPQYPPIQHAAANALKALGLQTGFSHMEWFRRPDGSVAISEVGARPPGAQFTSLMSYAYDTNFYRLWAELMIHDQFHCPPQKYAAGIAYLRGMGVGKVADVKGLEQVAQSLSQHVVEFKIPQPGQSPSGSYEGEGYIIVRHPDTNQVQQMLEQIITSVQVHLV